MTTPTLKGLHIPRFGLWNPFRVQAISLLVDPGWHGCAADPGL